MAIKKIAYEFDPFELVGVKPKRSKLDEARSEIADYVKEQVLSYVGEGKSPVSGGKWKRGLSKEYLEKKKRETGVTFANMELSGKMLDALQVKKRGSKLSLEITGKEAAKADGHNNFSGDSTLPGREFIPKKGKTFKRDIIDGIKRIAKEFEDGSDS